MIAAVRYELALLGRSQRWIPPLVLYCLAVAGLGASGGQPVGQALRWSALMLVPTVAWLTRIMLMAEPGAARACVAAATGPRRAQLAALAAALAGGTVLAVAGVAWALAAGTWGGPAGGARELGGGLAATVTCLLVGSAVGTACNPPLIRQAGTAMLSTAIFAVVALAWSASPANAAVTGAGSGLAVPGHGWPPGLPLVAAVLLAGLAWTVSALTAGRRSGAA